MPPVERCTRCFGACRLGGDRSVLQSLPVYGRNPGGKIVCDNCYADECKAELRAGNPVYGYIVAREPYPQDRHLNLTNLISVTTWGGAVLGTGAVWNTSRNGWNGSEIHYWAAVCGGVEVYGRNGGIGLYTTVRPRMKNGKPVLQ